MHKKLPTNKIKKADQDKYRFFYNLGNLNHVRTRSRAKLRTEASFENKNPFQNQQIRCTTYKKQHIPQSPSQNSIKYKQHESLRNKLGSLQEKLAQIKQTIQSHQQKNKSMSNKILQNNNTHCKIQSNITNKENSISSPTKVLKMKISGENSNKPNSPKNILQINNRQNPTKSSYSRQFLLSKQSPKNSNSKVQISSYITQVNQQSNTCQISAQQLKIDRKQKYKQFIQNYIYYVTPLFQSFSPKTFNCYPHREHFLNSFQFFKFCTSQTFSLNINPPKYPNKAIMSTIQTTRRNNNITKTIVFDLDQTLIHCSSICKPTDNSSVSDQKIKNADIYIQINHIGKVLVNCRPYLSQILSELSEHYQLILFTASHSLYANPILKCIDPNQQYFTYTFFRESCLKTQQGFYIKDLRILDRNMDNVLLVDNAAYSYCLQPENGVPIIPFYDDKTDQQLLKLKEYLLDIKTESSIKKKNGSILKNHEYHQHSSPLELIYSYLK